MNIVTEIETREEGVTARRPGQTTRLLLLRDGETYPPEIANAVRRAYQMGRQDARLEQQTVLRGLLGL